MRYASSTKYYLEDLVAGAPWITKLPFPVHVVERVETRDYVSNTKLVTLSKYHHGYYDGEEREFRGFGLVEQWDTEFFDQFRGSGLFDEEPDNSDEVFHLPPVYTKTWFHTGAFLDRDNISQRFSDEYYKEPQATEEEFQASLLPDTTLPSELTAKEEQEACCALKGSMLRQEIYALDDSQESKHPYTVTETAYKLRLLQPRQNNQYAVFYSYQCEALSYHYERHPDDPRIGHAMALEVDNFGNVTKSVAIGYPRRVPEFTEQEKPFITYTENIVTNKPDETDWYRIGVPIETRTYEFTGILSQEDVPYKLDAVQDAIQNAAEIQYEIQPTTGVPQKRLIEHVRSLYYKNDLSGPLPLGEVESLALPYEGYKLALTAGLLNNIFVVGGKVTTGELPNLLSTEGKYQNLDGDGHWWIPSGQSFFSPVPKNPPPPLPPTPLVQNPDFAREHFYLTQGLRDPFGNISRITYDPHDLLMRQTEDALENVVQAENDYRVMQPRLVTDPNGNRAAVTFDDLGMIVGTAVMGKTSETLGDSLANFTSNLTQDQIESFFDAPDPRALALQHLGTATTCIIYDLEHTPVCAASIGRETHMGDLLQGQETKVQLTFVYSDGFGREIQTKIQAEPGDVDGTFVANRWVGTGWTIFNNKGKPVKKYEPFFTETHEFEFAKQVGVSSTLFYDPLERVIATLHPNHTWEKVVFDPWQQTTYDVNDTVLNANGSTDPKSDEDVQGFFSRLPDADYLPTWYEQRIALAANDPERVAADKAAVHRQTPTVAHLDTLGRTFLTIAYNRFERNNAIIEEKYPTRVELDIEGNQRAVRDAIVQNGDALGRIVMRYDYDMLGNRIHQASMEAGERWMLNDVTGKPIRDWDSRGHEFRTAYDQLRRPTESYLREGAGSELLVGRTVYGETGPNPEAGNLRGKVVQLFDQAGVVTSDDYDFKGNLLRSQRELSREYKTTLDWSAAVPMEASIFTSRTRYDALNRPTELTAPDNSVIRPSYNEANLLERMEANLRGAAVATPFVTDIDYDAKGQRTRIEYGNGVRTTYEYDPLTFRLVHLLTQRDAVVFPDDCPQAPPAGWPGCQAQNLRYTFDPVGNITHIRDDAQQTLYFRNRRVEPSAEYTYDGTYRLIEATGREHLGQIGGASNPPTAPDAFDGFQTRLDQPGDGNAMGTYVERYVYDAVGNFLEMQHRGSDPVHPGWTRAYAYDETSQLETGKLNNRLSSTTLGTTTETYLYDGSAGLHGNITAMPHLPLMQWDYRDQLQATAQQVVTNGGTPETTWYVYDAAGRVRKVTERQAAAGQTPTRMKERIYLGGFEIYREYENDGNTIELGRETLHIMDDTQRIALVETRIQGNDGSLMQLVRYQLGNHLGSASLELDDQGQIISYEEYTPYGSTSYQAVRSQTETPKRYRYTGKERDEETGLNYHGARYYASWLGRWMAADPIELKAGVNLYLYCMAGPINYVDPSGTEGVAWSQQSIVFKDSPAAKAAEGKQAAARQKKEAARKAITDEPQISKEAAKRKAPPNVPISAAEFGPGQPMLPPSERMTHQERFNAQEAAIDRNTRVVGSEPLGQIAVAVTVGRVAAIPRVAATLGFLNTATVGSEEGLAPAVIGQTAVIGALAAGKSPAARVAPSESTVASAIERRASVKGSDLTFAGTRATAIHEAAGGIPKFRNYNPTVVLETAEGRTLVARGPTQQLSLVQRSALQEVEEMVLMRPDKMVRREIRIHPDIRVLVRAHFEGLTPRVLAVEGQPFCAFCVETIKAFGGKVVAPGKAVFP